MAQLPGVWAKAREERMTDFTAGPYLYWCALCGESIDQYTDRCPSGGGYLGSTERGMVVTGVDKENGTVTFTTVAEPSADDYVFLSGKEPKVSKHDHRWTIKHDGRCTNQELRRLARRSKGAKQEKKEQTMQQTNKCGGKGKGKWK